MHDVWNQYALDNMCDMCNRTQTIAIKTMYMDGFPCSLPEIGAAVIV